MQPDENLKVYSVACIKRGVWFWAAWESFDHYLNEYSPQIGDPYVYGYASTKSEAISQAQNATGPGSYSWLSSMASRYHRQRFAEPHLNTNEASGLEFVYADYTSPVDHTIQSIPYRIIKITRKRVYVDSRTYQNGKNKKGLWHSYDIEAFFTLSRTELERDGQAWSSTQKEMYYTLPIEARHQFKTPVFLRALGLTLPCTVEDVKRVYRQRAKEVHPDLGGSQEAFTQLQELYEKALAYVEER